MLVTRGLVERLEAVEAETVARSARALASTTGDVDVAVHPVGRGVLVATGAGRYVNRAVGTTLAELTAADVDGLVDWYRRRGLTPSVQLSSWAHPATVAALADRGFVATSSRSVLVRSTDPAGPATDVPVAEDVPEVEVVEVDDGSAADARDVMAGGAVEAGDGRLTSDEFMTADRAAEGTVQLLAVLDGRPVGCGSVTVVGRTAWLGAARTVPHARRRGVQTALVTHRVGLARAAGCDLVGATASVGSDSARNLRRLGFVLVQDQWVLEQAPRAT